MNQYGTTNPALIEARINHDPYDEFAWVQEWRSAIAQRLTDMGVNTSHFFRGSDDIRDTYAYEMIPAQDTDAQTVDAMLYALRILDRYREWLRIAGKDY